MKRQMIFSYKNVLQVLFISVSRVHPTHITRVSHSVNPALIFLFSSPLQLPYTSIIQSRLKARLKNSLVKYTSYSLLPMHACIPPSIYASVHSSIFPSIQLTSIHINSKALVYASSHPNSRPFLY